MSRLWDEPSPSDWEAWEARLVAGEDPKEAAAAVGGGFTCSAFRRSDRQRHGDLLALSREARADEADRRLGEWAEDPDASDQVKLYWHRYHANRAGRVQERVEVTGADGGPVEVVAGYQPPSLGDMVRLAGELGVLEQLGYERREPLTLEAGSIAGEESEAA